MTGCGLASGQDADFNHYYRSEQSAAPVGFNISECRHENCRAWNAIEWPRSISTTEQCRVTVPIGIIDTGINAGHEIIANADLEVISLAAGSATPSEAIHGTAVASLLIGGSDSRVPGLVPEAQVIAVDAFSRVGSDERADLVTILRGLDFLTEREVRVINLSLSGPENRLMERAIEQLVRDSGIVIVAAAGNGGPRAEASFPAAYEAIIAVTAVDVTARAYRHAQRGAYIDLAAPGVNILAATSISGARLKTGTSFATSIVTAAAALLLSQDPSRGPEDVRALLEETARDLGASGADEIFGHGLLQASSLCEAGQRSQP